MGNLKVSWERYAKRRNWTQCHRCQAFGHGEAFCYRKPRCVKCLEEHHTKNCSLVKSENSTPQCVNCKGAHTANYSKCPALLEYLEKRDGNRQPPNNTADNNNYRQAPQPQQLQRQIPNRNIRPTTSQTTNIRYSDAVRGNAHQATNLRQGGGATEPLENATELKDVLRELKEINEMIDLGKFIQLLKQLKLELRQCNSTTDKLMVLMRYIEIFE